jgi:hypothetical protein
MAGMMPLFMTAVLVSANGPVPTGASFIPPLPESVGAVASMSPPLLLLLLVLPLLLLVLPPLLLELLLLELAPPLLPLTPLLLLVLEAPPPLLLLVLLLPVVGVLSVPLPLDEQAIARTQRSDERGLILRMDVLPNELNGGAAYRAKRRAGGDGIMRSCAKHDPRNARVRRHSQRPFLAARIERTRIEVVPL